jgi:hypothetical protein
MRSHLSAIMTNPRGLVNLTGLLDSIPASIISPWLVRHGTNSCIWCFMLQQWSQSHQDRISTKPNWQEQPLLLGYCPIHRDTSWSPGTYVDHERTTCEVSFQKSLSISNQRAGTEPVSTKLQSVYDDKVVQCNLSTTSWMQGWFLHRIHTLWIQGQFLPGKNKCYKCSSTALLVLLQTTVTW